MSYLLFTNIAVIVILCFVSFLLLLGLYRNIIKSISRLKYVSIFLRFLILLLIIMFISDFNILLSKKTNLNSELNIFFDNSLSSKKINNENGFLNEIMSSIKNYSDTIGTNINYYTFGEEFRSVSGLDKIFLNGQKTDISKVLKEINMKSDDNNILISDGNFNSGVDVFDGSISNSNKLFIIETSSIENFDVKLDNFNYDKIISFKDSIRISLDVIYNLSTTFNGKISINDTFILDKNLEKTNKELSLRFNIPTHLIIDGVNKIEISSFENERDTENNIIYFNYNKTEPTTKILLLSGKISKNTSPIKNILNSFANFELNHVFRLSNKQIEISSNDIIKDVDLFIFDNFPYNSNDLAFANKIIETGKEIIFFESDNISDYAITFYKNEYGLEVKRFLNDGEFKVIDSKKFNIPKQFRRLDWICDSDPIVKYNDDSAALCQIDNILLVFISDLNQLHLKQNSSSDINYFYSYLKNTIKNDFYYKRKKFQVLNNKTQYYINQPVDLLIIYDDIYKNKIININIRGEDDKIFNDKIKLSNFKNSVIYSTDIDKRGEYNFKFSSELNIAIDSLDILIQDINIEEFNLFQNNIPLMKLLDNNSNNLYHYSKVDYLLNNLAYSNKNVIMDLNLRIVDYLYYIILITILFVLDLLFRRRLQLL